MRVVTWNVRGVCSPFKMHQLWQSVFRNHWDILCAVEHKDHKNAGLDFTIKGYTLCYAGVSSGDYSGVLMLIKDQYQPQVVMRDSDGRYIVVEILFEGQLLWIVGVYAPNLSHQRKLLWDVLNNKLTMGRHGFMMGDFNMCDDEVQSTSLNLHMDAQELQAWRQLQENVLYRDAWNWIQEDSPGFTYQSSQYRTTWSRIDRMYIMHDDIFLPEMLDISVAYDMTMSDHFPLVFDFDHQSVKQFSAHMGKAPLRFNSSYLQHDIFARYMTQLLVMFSQRVQSDGLLAWEVFTDNLHKILRYYGIHNANTKRQKLKALTMLMERCNALLCYLPLDEVLLEIQQKLSITLQDLQLRNYQQARKYRMQHEFEDNNCQSHVFFQGLHESHARFNVVKVEENGHVHVEPQVIIDKCEQYFYHLFHSQSTSDIHVRQARNIFLSGANNIVSQENAMALEADITIQEVQIVISKLPNGKSPGWDGITNEFFKMYASLLVEPLTIMFQEVWSSGIMPATWKIGLIKLLPKVPSPSSFSQWRPISLMGGIYKIFAKVIANRLQRYLPKIVHKSQYGFIKGRDILHNILNVQLAMDYVKDSQQELVMIQLDLEKAYDNVEWSFVVELMSTMGFGDRMSRLMYVLGKDAVSHIMMNGGVTRPIPLQKSLRQGCPLSPLLFAIVSHPILIKLYTMARDRQLRGLMLPSGSPYIAQALADDFIMFLGASHDNIVKVMDVWGSFAVASGLKVNMQKSILISCTERNVEELGWTGMVLEKGMICRHLGYPIGNDISSDKLVGWIQRRIHEKFMYWKSQTWPFHVRLKVVQAIMIPMVSYFLPLLPWSKKHIDKLSATMRFLLWKRKEKVGRSWMAWEHICTPKRLGGVALLNLYDHMVARRFTLLKAMFLGDEPWTEMIVFFIEKQGIKVGRTPIKTSWWNVVNCDIRVNVLGSRIVNHLVNSWKAVLEFIHWHPSPERQHNNTLQMELLATSRVLEWEGKNLLMLQFGRMGRLGLVTIADAMLQSQRKIMAFRTVRSRFRIPKSYRTIWDMIRNVPILQGQIPSCGEAFYVHDWVFEGNRNILTIQTNDIYHKLMSNHLWMEDQVRKQWGFQRPISWWQKVVRKGWHSRLPFRAKVFIWRVIVGGLPMGEALRKRNIDNGMCFWCTVVVEDNRHRFLNCPVAKQVWGFINKVWISLTGISRRPFHWVFTRVNSISSSLELQIVWDFLRYWGLWHIWRMRNAFIFEGQSGVERHVRKLKGFLLWQFYMLESSGLLREEEVHMCQLVCFHVRHLGW